MPFVDAAGWSLELQRPCTPVSGRPLHGSIGSNGPALVAPFDPNLLSAYRHPPGALTAIRRASDASDALSVGLTSIASAPHQPSDPLNLHRPRGERRSRRSWPRGRR